MLEMVLCTEIRGFNRYSTVQWWVGIVQSKVVLVTEWYGRALIYDWRPGKQPPAQTALRTGLE